MSGQPERDVLSVGRRNSRRASILAGVASGTLQIASLGVFALLSHKLPSVDLGAYRQILIIGSVASIGCAIGVPTAMLYFVGRARDSTERIEAYRASLFWLVVTTALCALVSGLAIRLIARVVHSDILAENAVLGAAVSAFGLHAVFIAPAFLSRGRATQYVVFAAAQTMLLCGLSWFFVARDPSLGAALTGAVLANGLGWFVAVLILFVAAGRSLVPPSRDAIGASVRYGAPVGASSALYALSYQIDHFVATRLLTPTAYTLYAAGAWQLPIGPLVQRAQADVLLPILSAHHSSGRTDEFWEEWHALIVPWAVLGAILFWAMFLLAGDIVHLVLGDQFLPSVGVLRIYSLLLPIRMAAFALPLRAVGVTWLDVVASILFGLVSLASGWFLTPTLGTLGPAIGVVLGYTTWVAVNLGATSRWFQVSIGQILPLREIATSMLVTGGLAVPLWMVVRHSFIDSAFARTAFFVSGYAVALAAVSLIVYRGRFRLVPRT